MAFINDVKEKISKTSQSTVQKAKELSETAKLNAAITDMEKQIAELYQEIGGKVYRYYRNDPISKIHEQIHQVTVLYKNIEDYKKQIENLSAIKMCKKCGTQVDKAMRFCYNCGNEFTMTPSETPASIKKEYCTCGNKIVHGSIYCTACGKKIN